MLLTPLCYLASCLALAAAQTSNPTLSAPGNASQTSGQSFPSPSSSVAPDGITGGTAGGGFSVPALYFDDGRYGPVAEIVHLYNDQWPIGLAVYAQEGGQKSNLFACYTRGDYAYTVGKIVNLTAEQAWPDASINSPESLINQTISNLTGYTMATQTTDKLISTISNLTGYTMATQTTDKLISVQALYTDPQGRLWALDTGRPTVMTAGQKSTSAYAVVGGPKLIRFDAPTGKVEQTITFPGDVHFPDSSMNDVRFDLRANVTESGQGIAYVVDSSNEGRNAVIVVDLGTGHSWRRLEQHPSMLHKYNNRASYAGVPTYIDIRGQQELSNKEGFDGIALSPDGQWLYYSPLVSQYLYRVPTSVLLRDNGADGADRHQAELEASYAVQNLGQKGSQTNGFCESDGAIYLLAPEQSAIFRWNYETSRIEPFARDPRFFWLDSCVIADDGYLYANSNQLPKQAQWNNGTERRQKPGVMWRVKLPGDEKRITSSLS
ncbi:PROTEIN YELLOW-RELATED [Ceraceosorus bombacis]|uniref:PROTEIN YELLOW-RELATED n=1 Tax=Ceraceosorus bombacis TaxID=401625 RepID=A0A0P1BNI1_9BASI|nr:PROTEIN YELLOW-RELATED [Ceraceosorus bombacis]